MPLRLSSSSLNLSNSPSKLSQLEAIAVLWPQILYFNDLLCQAPCQRRVGHDDSDVAPNTAMQGESRKAHPEAEGNTNTVFTAMPEMLPQFHALISQHQIVSIKVLVTYNQKLRKARL